jgi:signal transduction histidine kinase
MHIGTHEPAASPRWRPARGAGLCWRRRLAGALTGLVVLALLTVGLAQLRNILGLASQTLLYLLAVVLVALVGGLVPALGAAVAAAVLLDHYFIPPLYDDFAVADPNNVVALVAFVLVAGAVSSLVGLAARRREAEILATANAASRVELRGLVDEQAALRRIATLVARGVPAAEIFPAVAQEVGRLLSADSTTIVRLDPDGATTILTRVGDHPDELPVGSRFTLEPPLPLAVAVRTGSPARLDDFNEPSDGFGDGLHRLGIRSEVAAPITVEGRVWGAIGTGTRRKRFPADTEQRMADFTELVGTAIANAESRAQLEDSRDELRRLAKEQAALRRVATLVARGVPPAKVFTAVAQEVRHVLGAPASTIVRLDPDGATTVVARLGAESDNLPTGSRWNPEPHLAVTAVLRTGRPARVDDFGEASDANGDAVRRLGLLSSVAAPIMVEGHVWGGIVAGARHGHFPADTEERMAGFTELLGTAIANADSRAELTASRARIVAAADDARRRIERDLHDGTQQRLVALGLTLRLAQATVPADQLRLQIQIGRVADELTEATEELREIARGIHPAILSEGGLGPALRTLARRAAIPVELAIRTEARPPDPIEVAAYYIVSEALTNTTKHARASHSRVTIEQRDTHLHLSIRDDGAGGADPAAGSGLIGLRDRVQALGGTIEVTSRPGDGTAILVELPLQPDRPLDPPRDTRAPVVKPAGLRGRGFRPSDRFAPDPPAPDPSGQDG